MQKIMITGNIGQDATVETYQNNGRSDTVVRFRVAVNNRFTNRMGQIQEETTWYSCSLWNVDPRNAAYLLKGRRVYVEGIPRTRAYMNDSDQQWYVSNDIRVLYHEMQDRNPVNQDQRQAIPAGAVVNQPTSVAPSQWHMEQQQPVMQAQQPQQAAPQQIAMPERVTQEPMFPNTAPQLPEEPQTPLFSAPPSNSEQLAAANNVPTDLPY